MERLVVTLGVAAFVAITLLILLKTPSRTILSQNFDVYVINMAKNTQRMAHFDAQYRKSDLASRPYIRFEAINGKAMGDSLKQYVSPRVYMGLEMYDRTKTRVGDSHLTPGMIGCYLSHYAVYENIRDSGVPYAIIFEDDATIDPLIYKKIVKSIVEEDGTFPLDWDIILLGHICHKCKEATPHYKVPKYFWGLHGYIISQKGVETMLRNQEPAISMQIDHYMSELSQNGLLDIYSIHPGLVNQKNFGSDLQMPIRPLSRV